jgi:uncharacterized protein
MKKQIFQLALLFISVGGFAQESDFEKDIGKMLSINGSSQSYDMIFDQLVMQMKVTMPEIQDEEWAKIKADVFDAEIQKLEEQLMPVYKKYFTHEDVKAIIAFYESKAGKNLAAKTPAITQESMMIGQQWGMNLGIAIQDYLNKNGYKESKPLGE